MKIWSATSNFNGKSEVALQKIAQFYYKGNEPRMGMEGNGWEFYVRSPCPEFFQRPATEMRSPETAEEIQADAEQYAKYETYAVAADGIESEPPVIEDETAKDALQEVVGKAHLADALKVGDGFPHVRRIVQ